MKFVLNFEDKAVIFLCSVLKLITSTILNLSSEVVMVLSVFLRLQTSLKHPIRRLKSFDLHSLC